MFWTVVGVIVAAVLGAGAWVDHKRGRTRIDHGAVVRARRTAAFNRRSRALFTRETDEEAAGDPGPYDR